MVQVFCLSVVRKGIVRASLIHLARFVAINPLLQKQNQEF